MDPIVPVISSATTGPLGIVHLPRLWLKLLASARGRLAEGYKDGGGTFDQMVFANFAIDEDVMRAYVREQLPTYVQFEQWFREHASVDGERIARHNEQLLAAQKKPETARELRSELGIDDATIGDGVMLNFLDDLQALRAQIVQ